MRDAAATRFERLLAPGRIGSLELRNRLVMSPMGTNQERADGHLGEPILAWYEARARGGVGLVIAGVAGVSWPEGAANPRQAALSDDRFLPDWRELARRVHAHGARLAVQLHHGGKVATGDIVAGRPLLVPSVPRAGRPDLFDDLTADEREAATGAYRAPGARLAYREMDEDDLARVIERFAEAALRARRAGADAVELHAGHGYLIASFLSPASNRRSDAWGGGLEGRARLLTETLRAVRRRLGDDFPVWCRLDGAERGIEGGITEDDARRTAALAEAAGADAVHVSAYADPTRGAAFTEAPLVHAPGGFAALAAGIRARVGVPVIAVGRIEPEAGERLLREEGADFVALARALLADPELPRKLAAGQPERIRPCIYAYRCVGNVFLRRAARCTVNPAMGRESEGRPAPAAEPRHVVVVGAGPAGLEAARVAAGRGYRVTLLERCAQPGGTARVAGAWSPEIAALVDHLAGEVRRLGVDLRLGVEADAARVSSLTPDVVVLAGGGAAVAPPGVLARGGPPLRRLWSGEVPPPAGPGGGSVAVLGGDLVGLVAAAGAAGAGRRVTWIAEEDAPAAEMAPPRRWRLLAVLRRHGATVLRGVRVESAAPDALVVLDRAGERLRVAASVVWWAAAPGADDAQRDALAACGARLVRIGDANGPRHLDGALREASDAARAL